MNNEMEASPDMADVSALRPNISTHATDMLPAYINGTLNEATRSSIERHLAGCKPCQDELAVWRTLADVSRETLAPTSIPAPAPALMQGVWAQVDGVDAPLFMPTLIALSGAMRHIGRRTQMAGLMMRGQLRLIPTGIWLASTMAVVFTFVGLMLFGLHTHIDAQHIAAMQSLIAPLVTGTCLAFIYSPEHDSGLEIALSTPTSPRSVLLARLGLVFGYNFVLTFAVTLVMALFSGNDFPSLAALWLGPMLLLSALSLAASIGISTVAGVTLAGIFWLGHVLSLPQVLVVLPQANSNSPLIFLWQTSPLVLALAAGLLLLAVLAAPRRVPQLL